MGLVDKIKGGVSKAVNLMPVINKGGYGGGFSMAAYSLSSSYCLKGSNSNYATMSKVKGYGKMDKGYGFGPIAYPGPYRFNMSGNPGEDEISRFYKRRSYNFFKKAY